MRIKGIIIGLLLAATAAWTAPAALAHDGDRDGRRQRIESNHRYRDRGWRHNGPRHRHPDRRRLHRHRHRPPQIHVHRHYPGKHWRRYHRPSDYRLGWFYREPGLGVRIVIRDRW